MTEEEAPDQNKVALHLRGGRVDGCVIEWWTVASGVGKTWSHTQLFGARYANESACQSADLPCSRPVKVM